MHSRVSDLIDRLAAEHRTGLIFVDEYGHRRDYTFAEVAKHSLRYAAVLRAFGVQEGDRVYLRLPTTAKCTFTLLALARLGAHAVLDESEASGATTIIANRKYRADIDAIRDQFPDDMRYVIIGEECEGWARLDTLAHVASASVLPPPHDEPLELPQAREEARERLGAFATDTVWCALRIEDAGWFDDAIILPWLCGAAAVAHDGAFDARERLDLVRELDITILLQRAGDDHAELALAQPERFKMPRLRRCLVLGEGFEESLQAQWGERFGVRLTAYAAPSQQKV